METLHQLVGLRMTQQSVTGRKIIHIINGVMQLSVLIVLISNQQAVQHHIHIQIH